MSLLLYNGPKGRRATAHSFWELEPALLEERAKKSKKSLPPKLRFEEVIKNHALPPCSLNDFMDYLVYVENEAEYLQFFNWYCDYIQRWTKLPAAEKAKAPKWDPERARPATFVGRQGSLGEKEKIGAILDILDSERDGQVPQRSNSTTNFSLPRSPAAAADSEKKWTPFSAQPCREEINKVVRHYISRGAPRQLRLSPQERAACIHAVEHTTHPSALLPAFIIVETILRGRLHPNFIRWSVSNANRPLITFLRLLSALLIMLGIGVNALLVLSSWSRLWRLTSAPPLFTGFAILIAAGNGVSLTLHLCHRRQLRPWEHSGDVERGNIHMQKGHGHKRTNTSDSVFGVDPLRKGSLQPFGPKNAFGDEEWVRVYESKWLWRRMLDRHAPAQNRYIKVLQDGIIASAVLWSGVVSTGLVVGSYFIPSFNLF